MKCPKCGFNSFEYYDSCKKCATDLTGYKQTYSISSLVLPQEAKDVLATAFRSNESTPDEIYTLPEVHDDIFSFDLPDAPSRSVNAPPVDPFSFDEPTPAGPQVNSIKPEDDFFADLLESTSQTEEPSFAAQSSPVAKSTASSPSGTGEFDFDSFSWDDSPDAPATSGNDDTADDFDSLFGDTKEKRSK